MKVVIPFLALVFIKYCTGTPSTKQEIPQYIRQSWLNKTRRYHTECVCKTGVDPLTAFDSIAITQLSNDFCLRCYLKCLDIKLMVLDPFTGTFVKEEFIQFAGVTSEIFDKCSGQTEQTKDLCAKSFYMYLCIVHSLMKPVE
ncbi:hypothetical protein FQR65_LT03327 [Abscondita terminalis]|nr:hypothetical protein FQR65_LT03327 [Abscondita terminalis]